MRFTFHKSALAALVLGGACTWAQAEAGYNVRFELTPGAQFGVNTAPDGSAWTDEGQRTAVADLLTHQFTESAVGPGFGRGTLVSEIDSASTLQRAVVGLNLIESTAISRDGRSDAAAFSIFTRPFEVAPSGSFATYGVLSFTALGSAAPIGPITYSATLVEAGHYLLLAQGNSVSANMILRFDNGLVPADFSYAMDERGQLSLQFQNATANPLRGTLYMGTQSAVHIPAVPEPASVALMLAGLAVVGAAAGRAKRRQTKA